MRKRSPQILALLLMVILLWGCKDNSSGSDPDSDEPNIEEASSQKQFVWEALNFWYFWQGTVPKLSDNKSYFDDDQDYQDYLIAFSDAEDVFDDLLFMRPNFANGADDFSFFIEDFEAYQNSRQGISLNYGFEFGLVRFSSNSNNLFGYVQYVLPGTPADDAGLVRGDIFTGINGSDMTLNNYQSLLSNSSYELTLAESNEGELTETGETVSMTAVEIQEDPIYVSKVIDTGSSKVGYLMYNSFQLNSHEDLNDVFGTLLEEGIDELVLDLRYNGGGAVITSAILASMISGLGSSEIFAEYTFNQKRSNQGTVINFQDLLPVYNESSDLVDELPMNKLSSLDRLFVLTGFGTASASESVANGLLPFMDVIFIGRQTVGKDDASLTLYDAPEPYTNSEQANPNHKNAIQPIILKVRNANGQSNGQGFRPAGDNFIRELNYLFDMNTLPPLGDPEDPLLARALELVTGEPVAKRLEKLAPFGGEIVKDSRDLEQFGKDMYILPGEAEELGLFPSQKN